MLKKLKNGFSYVAGRQETIRENQTMMTDHMNKNNVTNAADATEPGDTPALLSPSVEAGAAPPVPPTPQGEVSSPLPAPTTATNTHLSNMKKTDATPITPAIPATPAVPPPPMEVPAAVQIVLEANAEEAGDAIEAGAEEVEAEMNEAGEEVEAEMNEEMNEEMKEDATDDNAAN
jgi:hypothetical protein